MRLSLFVLLLSCTVLCSAQQKTDIPEFGKIDKSELKMTECDFDKNAEAEVLFDVEKVDFKFYSYSAYSELTRHIRIKILKNKGLDQANIHLFFLSGYNGEKIENIKAQTYNLDGSGNIITTKLDNKSVFVKAINKRISEKAFSFPEVKVGSVIEYTYETDGDVSVGLRNWTFQKSIPVKLSQYNIDCPNDLELSVQKFSIFPIDEKVSANRGGKVTAFTMTNVPALRNEPFMTCEGDYLQRIEIRPLAFTYFGKRIGLSRSWITMIGSLLQDQDFGQQLTKNIPRTSDLDEMLKNVKDPYQKMIIIFRYVRKNMEWNGHSNIWAIEGVKSAWKQKKGTSGEINLILVNLLKDADIDASPVLVSTRENGRINALSPGYNQFDKVMAHVNIGDKLYVLDATDKYASPKLIPWEVMNSLGLVIEKAEGKWGFQTLWDENEIFNDLIMINGVIDEKGLLNGEATVTSYDYSRSKRLPSLKEGKEKFVEKYFSSPNPGLHLDSVSIQNEEIDTLPLIQKINFNQTLNSSGDYKYFSTNLFTGLEKNPFTADNRYSDIFFGANQKFLISESYFIPDGYSFDELPKNIRMMLPDTSVVFTRQLSAETDHIIIRVDLEFKRPVYSIEDYANFREFYKKLFELLNEQIVIKKNK
ncbi:MAG: DUF3857 and transglutaminase domain-containing protein [Bacteroidetes bacterium]|nr:DUF3857 and transglutaminase domain-containing protein [Bacteroidota bacterium]